jgi:hypothetical protein
MLVPFGTVSLLGQGLHAHLSAVIRFLIASRVTLCIARTPAAIVRTILQAIRRMTINRAAN